MSNLNKEFRSDPAAFMGKYAIHIDVNTRDGMSPTDDKALKPGIQRFDLMAVDANPNGVLIKPFAGRRSKHVGGSRPIKAYWLPWKSEGTVQLKLGTEADYFFTSPLAGCRFQIGRGSNPTVLHVAGNTDGEFGDGSGRGGLEWRRGQVREVFGKGYHKRTRRFSVTREYQHSECAFMIGFRTDNEWKFVAQGVGFDTNGHWSVAGLKSVDGAVSVIV